MLRAVGWGNRLSTHTVRKICQVTPNQDVIWDWVLERHRGYRPKKKMWRLDNGWV